MRTKSAEAQINERKEEIFALYQEANSESSRLRQRYNNIADSWIRSAMTKRIRKYEYMYAEKISNALYAYYWELSDQLEALTKS